MKYGVAVRFDDGTPRHYEVVNTKSDAQSVLDAYLWGPLSDGAIHSIKVVAIRAEGAPTLT